MDDKKQDKSNLGFNAQPMENKNEDEEITLDKETKGARGVLDQLGQVGGLEVEDMPESNELQERRRKTKSRLQDLASMKEPTEGGDEPFEEESGLLDLLREANLSPRVVKSCCGGVLALFVLIGLFFGGRALWAAWQNRPEKEPEEDSTSLEPEEDRDFLDSTVLGGILVGEDMPDPDEALDSGQSLGESEVAISDSFTENMADFATIYEAMQVNVNELLAQSNERRDTLEDYQNELNYLLYLGQQNVEKLEGESGSLISQFEAAEAEKAEAEERYFNELLDLDAYAAAGALSSFSEYAEEVVRLRAQYNARQKLLSYYEQVLVSMELRIRDIELNEEALLEGIQVFDIEGSDLDLIIEDEEL